MNIFTRRTLLRLTGSSLALAALSPRGLAAATPPEAPAGRFPPNSTVYRFRIGDYEAASLMTGYMDAPLAQPFFAPQATAAEFRAAVEEACLARTLRLPYNVLLVRTGRENILIDAGPGGAPAAPFDLTAALASLGMGADDITTVFLTHAHFDHLGGLLDAQDRVVFRRAEHFCLGEEIDFWMAAQPDFSRLRMDPAGMLAAARRVFERVPFTRIRPGTPLPAGVTPYLSPGHTPGQMTLRIESGGEQLYHISDLAHHSALMLPHPDWTLASDVDERQAAATRRKVFAELAAAGTRVHGFHLPYPGLGHLRAQGAGYRWVPEDWDPAV